MSTICIGGVCIPTTALIPLALIVLQSLWGWIRKNFLGQSDDHLHPNSRVVHIQSMEQWKQEHERAKENKQPVVVDYSASWCGPCRMISPTYHDLSEKYPSMSFFKVDVDEVKQVAQENGIQAMPTFHFFQDGKKVEEMKGADKTKLTKLVDKYAQDAPTSTRSTTESSGLVCDADGCRVVDP